MTRKDNKVRERIIKGLELTHIKLIKLKKDRNFDLVVSENGKVVRLSAKSL
jgi:hypothetical protein